MEAVRFEEVSKRFTIHHEKARTFQDAALNLLRFRRVNGTKEDFWALRDVSFGLERGRTLGVVGRNGSGKSTLLKLLAGTMRPTSGQITARGRVFGLLELAAGFHPDLSGRDNVFLNGAFLGLSRRHMAERFDQIVAFSELEQFIDTPVKHYSSGMYMRLGFAIAISVEPEILVIDEVLAVGDAAFRQKCFAALADLKQRQKTILFVTHDASAVRRFCDEAIWLDRGYVRAAGPAPDVLSEYLAATGATHGQALTVAGRPADPLALPTGPVTILGVETVTESGAPERHFVPGERIGVRVRFRAARDVPQLSVGIGLHRADGLYLSGTSSAAGGHQGRSGAGEGEATCWLGPVPLAAAEYTVSAAAWTGDATPSHRLSQAARFAVRPPRREQGGALVLSPAWEAGGALSLSAVPAVEDDTLRERPAGFRAGDAADQARPEGAFQARWRRPPSRLKMGEGDEEFLGPGWYPPEDWPPCVRWTTRRAVAYLTQDEWMSSVGVTMCRPRHEAAVPTGRVLVDGRLAGRFELTVPALEPFSFPLEPVSGAREVEVVLEIDIPIEPASGGESDDRRELGVAVHELWLE
ncbi:MAG TPA: ABC transporter ATP-binding protein [Chloroflexota bacterium]|nr:ABC transporter ATP-binding protein [Chloroflexota bacterium]